MTRVRVESFTISLDGYGAGPNQDVSNPLGIGGTDLHQWLLPTRTLQRALFGKDAVQRGLTKTSPRAAFKCWGMDSRRNMFGPIRVPGGHELERLVGRQSAYHVPVFILTHHARHPLRWKATRTFQFHHGRIREALDRAREAAAGRDVRIGGGPTRSSSIFVRALLMSCTLLSRRSAR